MQAPPCIGPENKGYHGRERRGFWVSYGSRARLDLLVKCSLCQFLNVDAYSHG